MGRAHEGEYFDENRVNNRNDCLYSTPMIVAEVGSLTAGAKGPVPSRSEGARSSTNGGATFPRNKCTRRSGRWE